ncbi:MAG TPA: hypothetical protein PLN07_05875, partial [Myxococcota bacterium]|nr:hypothetical protein [Myxococcota bacterium]
LGIINPSSCPRKPGAVYFYFMGNRSTATITQKYCQGYQNIFMFTPLTTMGTENHPRILINTTR